MDWQGEEIVLCATYSLETRFAEVHCGDIFRQILSVMTDDEKLFPIPLQVHH